MAWEQRAREVITEVLDGHQHSPEGELRRALKRACPYAYYTHHREAWFELVSEIRAEREEHQRQKLCKAASYLLGSQKERKGREAA